VLKISGEGFTHSGERGIAMDCVVNLAEQIQRAAASGAHIAIVLGGGNILRGAQFTAGNTGISEATAHYMGMLATVMNALALREGLESAGCPARVQTAIRIEQVAEPYIRLRAIGHLEKGRVVIFAGGTGNPFFTTDTTAALRAAEIGAEAVLKATKVEGVYDADPVLHPDARLFSEISYREVLERGLRVMDATAITMCMENDLPIRVFNISVPGNIARAVRGERVGTLVH